MGISSKKKGLYGVAYIKPTKVYKTESAALIEGIMRFFCDLHSYESIYDVASHTVTHVCGGCQARSKAIGSGPILVGVRAFKSHPPHIPPIGIVNFT